MAMSGRRSSLPLLALLAALLPSASLAQFQHYVSGDYGDFTASGGGGSLKYEPIVNVDEEAYLGLWLQAYGSASVIYTYQLGGNCVSAKYDTTEKNRTIRVTNEVRPFGDRRMGGYGRGYKDKPDYDHDEDYHWRDIFEDCLRLKVKGFLSVSPDVDGQGYVELAPGPLPFGIGVPDIDDVMYMEPGNYWIMMLGPIRDGKYQYAVVTNGPSKTQLFVLARDVAEFEQRWRSEVLWQLDKWGFTGFLNRPRATPQENCGYDRTYPDDDRPYDDYYYDDDRHKYDDYYDDYYYDDDRHKYDDYYRDDDW